MSGVKDWICSNPARQIGSLLGSCFRNDQSMSLCPGWHKAIQGHGECECVFVVLEIHVRTSASARRIMYQ